MHPRRRILCGYSVFLVAVVLIFSQCSKERPRGEPSPDAPADDRRKTPVVSAVETAMPSMVDISAESTAVYKGAPAVAVRPGTRQYVLIQPLRGVKAARNGAGVVVDRQGYILTNAHVVQGLDRVTVTFSDGKTVAGEVFGMEPGEDLAVVKVNPPYPLRAIVFADSEELMVGETVVAIGNPLGLGQSVSAGIISAAKRDIVWKNTNSLQRDLIQTDIALNVGNSGGPLLNVRGELIGINLAEPTGTEGISFAIPANRAKSVYEKIRSAKAK